MRFPTTQGSEEWFRRLPRALEVYFEIRASKSRKIRFPAAFYESRPAVTNRIGSGPENRLFLRFTAGSY
jgi:hypothetical protein